MAKNTQNEYGLPIPGDNKRTASSLLPRFFRTEANQKFLQATLDQLIQPGVAEKINGYFGRKNAKSYAAADNYIADVTNSRQNYQLEPALVIKDNLDNVTFYKDYNDYINQIKNLGGNTEDHSILNSQETYPWNPNIDWDKFVNFREYYWLSNGPMGVPVRGQSREVVSTYTVTLADDGDNTAYVFSPNGFTRNPSLKLYRGQKYRFEIDTPGHPMAFALTRSFTPGNAIIVATVDGVRAPGLFDATLYGNDYDIGDFIVLPDPGGLVGFEDDENVSTIYSEGQIKLGEEGEQIANVYVEKGVIEFTIPFNSPDKLFYISKNDIDTSGILKIYDIEENTFLDIENEILGKKTYTSSNGVVLSNGMKIYFQGDVTPNSYETGFYYVEGVGDKIKLINEQNLIIPIAFQGEVAVPFDVQGFDTVPFEDSRFTPIEKEYIVINKASQDRNPWSRFNRWVHKNVIIKTAEYNQIPVNIDESLRATRPIIEFEAGLKLYQYGTFAKTDVDLVDTFTQDVFSTIEGSIGYNIDGVNLAEGMRILFLADTDILVKGKIFKVKFVRLNNVRQISLIPTEDTEPLELETVFVTKGEKNAGLSYYYENEKWHEGQAKTNRNQSPMFDLCCPEGNFYGDLNVFDGSDFKGTKIFSYAIGEGVSDTELGFPLTYRNIENSGDILFEFNLLKDTFTVQSGLELISVSTSIGNLRKYSTRTDFQYVNGWSKTPYISKQKVIRQYVATLNQVNNFAIDVYDKPTLTTDIKVNVFVNNSLKKELVDYELDRINNKLLVRFYTDLVVNDVVLIKTNSSQPKNNNGWYDVPINLERNPQNEDISTFTLGEVIDHVNSMLEDIQLFEGAYLGPSNLRDLGDLDFYGKRFVKHSGPINLAAYHITNKKYNLIKALEYSKREYSRFKRTFLDTAVSLGYDGPTKEHVDKILAELNRDKIKTQPFYFSDMVGYGTANKITYEVLDARNPFYGLSNTFVLTELSNKSVIVYLNGKQLVYKRDYDFNTDGYVLITSYQQEGDIIEIYEYETTNGSFIPETPSKLGLYPKYEPEITIDDTYITQEPSVNGPYKIYGELNNNQNQRGWFYPVYISKRSAELADTNNQSILLQFKGLNRLIFAPANVVNIAAQDNIQYEEYPVGIAMIRGHDGSFVRAYKDFRDELLIDLENRIYNNIKATYNTDILDIHDFMGGKFRDTKFSRESINNSLLKDFTQWLRIVDNDYTSNDFYDRENPYTYNYSFQTSVVDGKLLPGFWRGIYIEAFDTDRPHSHPWEMLGFTIKPKWWDEVYGPAPYTSNNLILWNDLEQGIVREPNKQIRILSKYIRPGLTNFIPSDNQGRLKDPISSNYAQNLFFRYTNNSFAFGDHAPVETAWRRSSEYPFALIRAWILNQPAKIVGLGFDTSRITKNLVGQYVYTKTLKPITLTDIVFPTAPLDESTFFTSGLINYITNLIQSNVSKVYEDYKKEVASITNQLGIKIGGFTDKNKFKIILDSKSPIKSQAESIFVPQENYDIFLNVSSPVDTIIYSGVVIEKQPSGYTVRGYNDDTPYFNYFSPVETSSDIIVNVGGISEVTVEWEENKVYAKGQVISYQNQFYRVLRNFTSGTSFDTANVIVISELPVVGGKTAIFRRNFNKNSVNRLVYGTRLPDTQSAVDFILGYDAYLKNAGFEFNYFNQQTGYVENWDHAAREFLFWTTQNWAAGASIVLSPAANEIFFKQDYVVVDDIYDDFYEYTLLKSDGLPLERRFGSILRDRNSFGISTRQTDDGIFNIKLPLVQKEHVVLLDNKTIFNDVIYQPSTGYRQERLRILGYRSDDWDGSLNIPGFVYDDASFTEWEPWQDYTIGSLVKHKQFYYVALYPIVGSEVFNDSFWFRLNEKPESQLITNFDYRINQFTDFYDLDSDNFDAEQQRLAQHLIGYQKRDYLANIINDDVSQYKFYQGFIQEKGTRNSLEKLFNKLSEAGQNSLKFYEEWALQTGRYGAATGIEQVEFELDETKFQESPQAFELTNSLPKDNFDKIYRILPYEVLDKPENYNHSPFPTTNLKEYILSGGYVHEDDVEYKAGSILELATGDINQVAFGEYIWLIDNNSDEWTVYQITKSIAKVNQLINNDEKNLLNESILEIVIDRWTTNLIESNDIVGIKGASEYLLFGLYKVDTVKSNRFNIVVPEENEIAEFEEQSYDLIKLRKVRVANLTEANLIIQQNLYPEQKIWIDNFSNGDWAVIQNNPVYSNLQTIVNPQLWDSTEQEFSRSMSITDDNRNLIVSSSNYQNGIVYFYRRTLETNNLVLEQEITPPSSLFNETNSHFGESISISDDGKFLAVGVPYASDVLTRYKGIFDNTQTYNKNDIVKYRETLWKANRTILPEVSANIYSTFETYVNILLNADADSTEINLLYTGNLGLDNSVTDHFLVRPPVDMYNASQAGDEIKLFWNTVSYSYPTLDEYFPWNGVITELYNSATGLDLISQTHTIAAKVEKILVVPVYITLPILNDRVSTDTGSGIVSYVDTKEDSAVIYLSSVNGTFDLTGELYVNDTQFAGFYSEELTVNTSEILGNLWLINTVSYNNRSQWTESGRGLVYVDFLRNSETRTENNYFNIQTAITEIGPYISDNNRASFIEQLSSEYNGDFLEPRRTDLFVIRGSKDFTDILSIGDEYEFRLYNGDNRTINVAAAGLSYDVLNKKLQIEDLWDGYIDFEYTNFDFTGNPFEPIARYYWNGTEYIDRGVGTGDILEDVQTPIGTFTSITTSSVEVMFYKRDFLNVRVYVKRISGNWQILNNIQTVELRRLANTDPVFGRGPGDVNRIIGTINSFANNVVLGNSIIGKLIVVKNTVAIGSNPLLPNTFDIVANPAILDEEYWFFQELLNQSGIGRAENPPNSLNKDYTQVYNINANDFGTAGPVNAGAVALYRNTPAGFKLLDLITSEYSVANKQFGKKVKLSKKNNLYTLFVSSVGNGTREHPGSIEIFKHGTTTDEIFVGTWSRLQTYNRNEIVEYQGNYYKAKKDITEQTEFSINDSILWNKISWRRGQDENYRGIWNNQYPYAVNSIVNYEDQLYSAKTNIAAGAAWNLNSWSLLDSNIDYLGYLPNLTGNSFYGEQVFDPATNIERFAKSFDVSKDGSILVVTSQLVNNDSTSVTKVVIYRLLGEKYIFSQTISAPDNTNNFAESVSINPSGLKIAVGESLNDNNKLDQGLVYIYSQTNGTFVLSQTLISPNNEEIEKFGYQLYFGEDNLVVASLNGDMKKITTFDVDSGKPTTFDKGFTEFSNRTIDTGSIYIFELLQDSLIYSESFRYDLATSLFGETLLSKNNHVYVGMPRMGSELYRGTVLDYRKPKNKFAWNITRELIRPVDVQKIRGVFLYDKRKNEIVTYLDYIDPIQGKIAGPAEQELTFKTPYDPATYNSGANNPSANLDYFWAEEHVGKLWWNIREARFTYPYQGDVQYQKTNWNELQPGASIQVYEWVESNYLPSQWDEIADTDQGIGQAISGVSLYGDDVYTERYVYDNIAQSFTPKYYFWVQFKATIPLKANRSLSAIDVAKLIANPREQGYRFISLLSNNRFVLNNVESLIYNNDIVLNVKWLTIDKPNQALHSVYQILTDGVATSLLNSDIERKWYDSLIGYDEQNRKVPNPDLTVKQKYGVQNRPRQSMFVNRIEALKQVIERVNIVLKKTIVIDEFDISSLFAKEDLPSVSSGDYDVAIDTIDELRFISTNKIVPAQLEPVIQNGKIIKVRIINPGRGYKVAPSYEIFGNGIDAEFEITINNLGQINNVTIVNEGKNYVVGTRIIVRKFTVLVNSDSSVFNKWALYSYDEQQTNWFRKSIQDYDVSLFWNYVDWYDTGFNENTAFDYIIDEAYELTSLNDSIGDIVKIKNVGTGGWLLLEKEADEETEDYSVNYKTIGRENGTIQFLDTLYDNSKNNVGFDNISFDRYFYDNDPRIELRIILQTIRDNLFVKDLKVEYNQLFISSLRYILSEQANVDWFFKTSFVSLNHNLGQLKQDITFNSDTLPSYQKYVEEVKPFKTVIREFVSSYESLDNTNSAVTDFDLPPYYDNFTKTIQPSDAKIIDNTLIQLEENVNSYPRKFWLDNVGYSIKEIKVRFGGSGYTYPPVVRLIGGGGEGATAQAYLGYGSITAIKVTNPGSGYTSAPTIVLDGSIEEGGQIARASAILGNGLVRSPSIKIKFDRISGSYFISTLTEEETFTGTNVKYNFDLKYPIDTKVSTYKVYIDDEEQLRSSYVLVNLTNTTVGYTRIQGQLQFAKPPANESNIRIEYKKSLSMLSAEDRIQFGYESLTGMLGKDLAQLMDGVDYGGVEVKSFDFTGPAGWDTKGWYTDTWDEFDNTFEDEIFRFDESTTSIELSQPLQIDTIYNVYLNGIRIDDPNYGIGVVNNVNAIMPSLVGDGSTQTIDIANYGIEAGDNDVLIIRKISSDGAFTPDPLSYDTSLSGGDLQYGNATGTRAEDIIVDGDNFVTPTTSKGPEELVPGQILDTLDIKVYTKETDGQGIIFSQSYIMNSAIDTYDLGIIPGTKPAVLIKMNNQILSDADYNIDWLDNTVTILSPMNGVELNIIAIQTGVQNIVDYGSFTSDESSTDYVIPIKYFDNAGVYVTVDGNVESVILSQEEITNKFIIRFNAPLLQNQMVRYVIFSNNEEINYSQITKDNFTGDGSTNVYTLSSQLLYAEPTAYNVLVKIDNTVLNPGYSIEHVIPQTNDREYPIEAFQFPVGTLNTADVKVFLNGEEIQTPNDWRLDIANSSVILSESVGIANDVIKIYVLVNADYTISGNVLTLDSTPLIGQSIEVFKFTNHNILSFERINYDVVARSTVLPEDIEYKTYNRLTIGEITLRRPAIDAQYVWVAVNGELLSPSVDYNVSVDGSRLQLLRKPNLNDVLDIVQFTAPVRIQKFAFRQFKDIMNRTHYKRLDSPVAELSQDLNYYDLRIEVTNGTNLPEPNKGANLPGVIFIDGERIEYFVKENNTLRQLRRGTLGTGIATKHLIGTDVYDQSAAKNIPYKDLTQIQTITGDGISNTFALNFVATNVNQFEVFVGGKRLRKNSIQRFNQLLGLDSPAADETIPAEFTLASGNLVLSSVPADGVNISVIRKLGKLWTELGVSLGETQNDIGFFVRSGTSALPE